jgi:hypothetical protein
MIPPKELLPQFSFPPANSEDAASILSEASPISDSLFEDADELPRPILPTQEGTQGLSSRPSPSSQPTPASQSRLPQLRIPVSGSAAPATPPPSGSAPSVQASSSRNAETALPPSTAATPAPADDPGPFRFGNAGDVPTPPMPISLIVPVPVESGESSAPSAMGSAVRSTPPRPKGVSPLAFFVLAAYAALATCVALYGLFFRSAGLPPTHPLAAIPDTFGEYEPASRKKIALRTPLTGPLPEDLIVPLGGTLTIGQLCIEPLRVEERPLLLITEVDQKKREEATRPALVLHLKLSNTSSDLVFHPVDPALMRKASQQELIDQFNGTRLEVGPATFVGGPLEWPFRPGVRRYEAAQHHHDQPLQPGESREFVICSPDHPDLRRALRNAPADILWRVHLRTGLLTFQEREIPITSVIGVRIPTKAIQRASS